MTSRTVSATIRAGGYTIRGTYRGGPYIDLSFIDPLTRRSGPAWDVINVWDYAAGRATIPQTVGAVRAALREWRAEYGDSLRADLGEYALMVRGL